MTTIWTILIVVGILAILFGGAIIFLVVSVKDTDYEKHYINDAWADDDTERMLP